MILSAMLLNSFTVQEAPLRSAQYDQRKTNTQKPERHIACRGTTKHPDHFDQLLAADAAESGAERKSHFETITV